MATVTQRVVLSVGERDTRFIILPTVSLRVEQMGEGTERVQPPGLLHQEMEALISSICTNNLGDGNIFHRRFAVFMKFIRTITMTTSILNVSFMA